MRVLTVNSGSSTLKLAAIETTSWRRLRSAVVELGLDGDDALPMARRALADFLADGTRWHPQAVAHRLVHGGDRFSDSLRIEESVRKSLAELTPLAPLHIPAALMLVDAAMALLPDVPHVAVFDTAFHATLPESARRYALPEALCTQHGIRRYGFHGLSHRHVADQVAAFLGRPARALRIVSCHLGNGASITAIEHGASTETSMGMTPLEGLVMGTRAGDLDPGVLLALLRSGDFPVDALDRLLNSGAGLKGMTGSADLRDIEARAAAGDDACIGALCVYAHRVRKYVGAYAATMGGVDVIAFTGGIGEHGAAMRSRCLQRLGFLGAVVHEDRNRAARVSPESPVVDIATDASTVRIIVVAADEERVMAQEAVAVWSRAQPR